METKICTRCKLELSLNNFHKDKTYKDGHKAICKTCKNENQRNSYDPEKRKEYNESNKDVLKENKKKYYEKNKEYYKNNLDKIKNRDKEYKENNKDKISERRKEFYKKNKKEILLKQKLNHNKEKRNLFQREKRLNDPIFALKSNISATYRKILNRNGYKKNLKSIDILGCSYEEFKLYLESKFEPWMNWENRGLYNGELNYGWDIDHIIPLSSATCEEDIIRLNHYTNLQPLCSHINRDIKRDNI